MVINTAHAPASLRLLGVGLLLLLSLQPCRADEAVPTGFPADSSAYSSRVRILMRQAESALRQAHYEPALEALIQAYELSIETENKDAINDVLNAMANVYYLTGQLDQARRYYRELVAQDENGGDQAALAVSLYNLGHVNASAGNHREARQNFQRALALSRTLGDDSGVAHTQKALGVNAQAEKNPGAARSYMRDALRGFERSGDWAQVAVTWRHLGDIAQDENQLELAVQYYMKALPVLAEHSFDTALMRAYRGLGTAYAKMGLYEHAFSNYRAYSQLMQLQMKEQNRETTQRLQVSFETGRFAADNEKLGLVNQSQQRELRHQQDLLQLQYLAIGLVLAILTLVWALWWRSRLHGRRMEQLASNDELTGLLNRRGILQFGQGEWQRASRFKRPFCCVIFDIDNFKSINDTWGHKAGDQVLTGVANLVNARLRSTDALGRFGGEEFLLVAPETEAPQAQILAERIRAGLESQSHGATPGRTVTVSIGIAQVGEESTLDELIAHADEALYQAKESGKNRVDVYLPPRPTLNVVENSGIVQPAGR
jgi:diguanylate cyclase (GGDEF)-like protein